MRIGTQGTGFEALCDSVFQKLGDNILIVEIGSYAGDSVSILSNKFPNSIIHSVDMWEGYDESCSEYDRAKQAIELREAELEYDKRILSLSNVEKHKMSSVDFSYSMYDQSVKFCYIDANHQTSSVIEDLRHWIPKIAPAGIISGHDFHWPSVKAALDIVFNRAPDETFCDGSWMYKL
jgi:predicted O-methyltransferase YrrM